MNFFNWRFIRSIIENLSILFVFHPFKIYEFKQLNKNVKFSKYDTILDIGCGNGLETLLLGKKCEKILGIDIFKENLAIAKFRSHLFKKHVKSEFKLTKIENAGFKPEMFDKIFSVCVLEHISNYIEVLSEAYKVLKNKGQLIMSVDSLENIEDKNFIDYHTNKYGITQYFRKEELENILKKIGFKQVIIYPIFKSRYATKRFIKLMSKITIFDHLVSILDFIKLKKKESRQLNGNKGLSFIVKCYK